ncbi:hypothetical protein [Methanolobus sp. WCC5]|jgi:hypothetical protein|uniref:hypothetical protein n=1 Tax=Methanolobus sp. WCC5 TaxID=3125785 RepID=UPI003253B03C
MAHDEIIENVKNSIIQMKGVGNTLLLNEEDREIIKELEKKADEMTLMGLGRGDNKGVKAVLKNDVIFAFTTNMDYSWPEGPNVILMHNDCVVGQDLDDQAKLEEIKTCKDKLVIGNIVIYDTSVLKKMDVKTNPLIVVLPPKPCKDVECVDNVCNVVLASPSPPTDEYLKEKMGLENLHGTGTFLLGFDFDCSCE